MLGRDGLEVACYTVTVLKHSKFGERGGGKERKPLPLTWPRKVSQKFNLFLHHLSSDIDCEKSGRGKEARMMASSDKNTLFRDQSSFHQCNSKNQMRSCHWASGTMT